MDLRAVAVAALLTSLALGAAAQVACPEGFYGVNCALCQTDAGCAAAGAPGATCSAVFSYSAASERKSYGCELEDDGFLSELVVPGSVAVSCATGAAGTAPAPAGGGGGGAAAPAPAPAPGLAAAPGPAGAPALAAPPPPPLSGFNAIVDSLQQFVGRRLLADPAAPVAAGATCEYAFTVKDGGMRVACAATQCALPAGALGATCAATKCACPDSANCGGGLVASLAGGVSGASSFTCSAAGACQLKMTGLPIQQLAMTCTAAECLAAGAGESGADGQPGDGGGGGGAAAEEESTASGALTPALAAIPAMLLLLACGAAGAYVWANRALWGCPPEEAAAAAKALGAGGAPVGRLEFRSLSVALALGARARARKAAALRATALARGASRPRDAAAPDASAEFGAGGGPAAPAPPPPNPLGSALARLRRRPRAPAPPPAAPPAEDEDEAAAAAADFVAGLHAGGAPGEWAVLAGVSGAARGGEVVGLLGPSGCGKTTLLSALAGSAPDLGAAARVRGAVLVDGAPRRAADVAYVPQADHLIPTLTVQECLRYSALLRLPRGAPPGEVQARVDAALAELGLRHVADAAVGGSGGVRGVSGGERRRVTIGMELVTDPRILVLDEPTSGLDSFSALSLLRALRAVAARGRVVVASLHQPSADMFYALDRVMLMAHGHVLYAGRPGDAAAALAAAGCPVPEGAAVAEHLLQVASSPADLRRMLAAAPAAAAPGSPGEVAPLGAPPAAALDALEGGGPDDAGALTSAATAPPRPQGAARQLAVMFWRTLVDVVRNPALLALHAGVALAMGVVFGLIFWQLDDDSVGVQNRMGGTFFALAFLAFTSLTTVDLLMNERLVVHREVRGGYYSPAAYLASKLALDGLLLRVLPALLYWAPFYYMAGFLGAPSPAATYALTLVAFNCTIGALSVAVSAGCATAGRASFVMNFLLLFMLAFTGFLVNIESIPAALRWIANLSAFFWAFQAMLGTQLAGESFTMVYRASSALPPVSIPGITGSTFMSTLGYDISHPAQDVGILVAMYAAAVLIALGVFYANLPRQRAQRGRARPRWLGGKGAAAEA